MVVPQRPFRREVTTNLAGRLDFADAGRRPEVIDDRVRPAESGERHDLFVVDALALKARLVPVLDVTLLRDRPEFQIRRHGAPSR